MAAHCSGCGSLAIAHGATSGVPLWFALMTLVLAPALALVGSLLGARSQRVSAVDLEKRSQREEVMRNVRWAADKATSPDRAESNIGMSMLNALRDSPLTDDTLELIIQAALQAILFNPVDAFGRSEDTPEVVGYPNLDPSQGNVADELSSEPDGNEGGAG